MLGLKDGTGAVLCTQHPTVGMSRSALSHWLLPDFLFDICDLTWDRKYQTYLMFMI